jgi:hypothetical protein
LVWSQLLAESCCGLSPTPCRCKAHTMGFSLPSPKAFPHIKQQATREEKHGETGQKPRRFPTSVSEKTNAATKMCAWFCRTRRHGAALGLPWRAYQFLFLPFPPHTQLVYSVVRRCTTEEYSSHGSLSRPMHAYPPHQDSATFLVARTIGRPQLHGRLGKPVQ